MEREDLQQERDSVNQRARVAEARVVTLRDRVSRLQEQLTTLHTDLDQHRNHRLELSEEISQGARSQLEAWVRSRVSSACFLRCNLMHIIDRTISGRTGHPHYPHRRCHEDVRNARD